MATLGIYSTIFQFSPQVLVDYKSEKSEINVVARPASLFSTHLAAVLCVIQLYTTSSFGRLSQRSPKFILVQDRHPFFQVIWQQFCVKSLVFVDFNLFSPQVLVD